MHTCPAAARSASQGTAVAVQVQEQCCALGRAGWTRPWGSAASPPGRRERGLLQGPEEQHFGFLQTKALIDKLQKLVSSEGRFKNLREALKK